MGTMKKDGGEASEGPCKEEPKFGRQGNFFFFFFLGPHLPHMEIPRLGVESKLQLLAYNTATATQDLSHFCDLHHSSQLHQTPSTEQGQGSNPHPHGY